MGLTLKQEAFCLAYLEKSNAIEVSLVSLPNLLAAQTQAGQ